MRDPTSCGKDVALDNRLRMTMNVPEKRKTAQARRFIAFLPSYELSRILGEESDRRPVSCADGLTM
jgi:hypothetical protein